jgi:hypothetical protein
MSACSSELCCTGAVADPWAAAARLLQSGRRCRCPGAQGHGPGLLLLVLLLLWMLGHHLLGLQQCRGNARVKGATAGTWGACRTACILPRGYALDV